MKLEQLEKAVRLSSLLDDLQGMHDDVVGLGHLHVTIRGTWYEDVQKAATPAITQHIRKRIEDVKQEMRVMGIEVE